MAEQGEQVANSAGDTDAAGDTNVGAAASKPESGKTSLPSQSIGTSAGTSTVEAGTGPGDKDVGATGIVVLSLYLIAAILFCFFGLIVLWPGPSPSGQLPPGKVAITPTPTPSSTPSSDSTTQSSLSPSAVVNTPTPTPSAAVSSASPPQPARSTIKIFRWEFQIWDEHRLLLIVMFAGALGSLVHTVRSVFWYVGNRSLKWSWLAKYVLQPFAGTGLAVIFYVVVRGGFFSPQTTFDQTSPFGFAALAALVGLFSEQAVLKLKDVAEMVFAKPAPGADAAPQAEVAKKVPSKQTPGAESKPQTEVAKAVSPKSVPDTQAKPEEKGSSSSPDDVTKADTQ